MASREAILARLFAILEAVAAADSGTAGRNLPRTDDGRLPFYGMYDGNEEATDNVLATGGAPNVVHGLPEFTITLMDDVATIGTTANAKLAALQKAILLDAPLLALCKGFRPAGARYLGSSFSVTDDAKKATAELTARFSVAYTFVPAKL